MYTLHHFQAELKQGLHLAKNRARANMMSDQRNCIISTIIKESLSKVSILYNIYFIHYLGKF